MAGINHLVANGVTLTATPVPATIIGMTSGMYFHTLYLKYTPGEDANVLTVLIESSPQSDGTPTASSDWYQDAIWASGSSHYTGTVQDIQLTGVSTTTQYKEFPFTTTGNKIRITWSEAGDVSPVYGTLTAELLSVSPS